MKISNVQVFNVRITLKKYYNIKMNKWNDKKWNFRNLIRKLETAYVKEYKDCNSNSSPNLNHIVTIKSN